MSYEQPPRGRLADPFEAADRRHVPLRTILVTVGVVVATYLAGKLMYLLRESPAPAASQQTSPVTLSPSTDPIRPSGSAT